MAHLHVSFLSFPFSIDNLQRAMASAMKIDYQTSKVYTNINLEMPPEYYDYDNFQVQWG